MSQELATAEAPEAIGDSLGRVGMAILDSVLNDADRTTVNNYLSRGGWKFGWQSTPGKDRYSFWHRHFAGHRHSSTEKQYPCAEELLANSPLLHRFWSQLAERVLVGHTLVRCYANAHAFGSEGSLHTDSTSANSFTAIYYPHEKWFPNWAGETILFDDDNDILAAIYPRPNRLAVFRGNIPHVARGVSRVCPVLRVTLMFKTEYGPAGDAGSNDQA